MSKEQLLHIFDDSACLTKRQIKEYTAGVMTGEEAHAVEIHLNSCPFCNTAVEGLLNNSAINKHQVLTGLNADFLNDHYSVTNAEIHLNSIAHTYSGSSWNESRRRKRKMKKRTGTFSLITFLLLGLGIIWWYNSHDNTNQISVTTGSDNNPAPQSNSPKAVVVQPPTDIDSAANSPATKENISESKNRDITEPRVKQGIAEAILLKGDNASFKTPDQPQSVTVIPVKDSSADAKNDLVGQTNEKKDKVKADKPAEQAKSKDEPVIEVDKMDLGDNFYKQDKFDIALAAYSQEMKDPDPGRSAEAAFKAAQCYIALGKKDKAISILKKLEEEETPQKSAAGKLLSQLN